MWNEKSAVAAVVILGLSLAGCGGGGETAGGAAGGGTSQVSGILVAPVGAQVTLQNNGGSDLSVTAAAAGTDDYNWQNFTFNTAQANGASYSISILDKPANQTCSVFKGATGTVPVASGALKVGCEYNYDLVSRSTDDSVISYGTYNQATVIGGAAEAVGATPAAYGEGRFVAFVSYAPGLAAGVGGSVRQVFWRDRWTGETQLVSATTSGTEGNADSGAPAISADGLTVVFESSASNLVAGDTNGVKDIFVWSAMNRAAGVQRVSVSNAGVQGNAASSEAVVSGDGKVVAFTSYASNLGGTVGGTTNPNVYRRVLATGTNTLVSHANGSGGEGNFGSSQPSISEDGTRIAFWSYASNLVASDGNGLWDIFVYDSTADTNTRVSLANGGGERNQGGDSASSIMPPTISGNGRYVAYSTLSTDVVAGDTNGVRDVFVVDTNTSGAGLSVVRASVSSAGAQGNNSSPMAQSDRISLSYDGNLVAFATSASNLDTSSSFNVVVRNRSAGTTSTMTATGGASPSSVSMSRTGAYVNFLTTATGLDTRFSSSGVYARYTGISRAWAWLD